MSIETAKQIIRAAVERVIDLHSPAGDVCAGCGDPYPCTTVLELGNALAEADAKP